jgi:membrane protein YdbS with pleckstrin-like domain
MSTPRLIDAPSAVDAPLVVDFCHRFKTSIIRLLLSTIVVILLAVSCAIFLQSILGGPRWVSIGAASILVLLVIFLAVIVSFRVARARMLRAIGPHESDPQGALTAGLSTIRLGQSLQLLPLLAQRCVQNGAHNLVLRVAWQPELPPIEPLTVEFEPTPLSEADEGFLQLATATGAAMTADRRELEASLHSPEKRITRRLKQFWRVAYGVVLANVLFWLIEVARLIHTGRLTWTLLFLTAILGTLLLAPRFQSRTRRFGTLAVPGGLIRRAHAGQKTHLFRRTSSVLIVFQYTKHQWAAAIGDADEQFITVGTFAEIEFLQRAWLSPLPPPTAEQVNEL